ncbi:hypothetical protein CBW65_15415 [Tumebacillus avium]|uniref:RNA polymerase subunit sigma-70 n=1 Tax=Tumebacillus avium TaxID=1903704 RepID=A0A1Y0IPL4_9BACL|nr:RNA polymerase sigma factor [Tumebacillus avium]ARU62240.1 hypothetical protein CBW65_15415 [Tumebacillus avium]
MSEPSKQEAIEGLFALYADEIYRYARYTLQDHAEAKDVVQEVFFRAFQRWDSFRHDSSYKTWLLTIARNYMYDLLRKKKTRLRVLTQWFTRQEDIHPLAGVEERMVLEESLALLKESYRQVIILRHVQELSVAETAEVLGWTEGKVRTTLHRALHKLRELTEGDDES